MFMLNMNNRTTVIRGRNVGDGLWGESSDRADNWRGHSPTSPELTPRLLSHIFGPARNSRNRREKLGNSGRLVDGLRVSGGLADERSMEVVRGSAAVWTSSHALRFYASERVVELIPVRCVTAQ